jgi:hypothetical protein
LGLGSPNIPDVGHPGVLESLIPVWGPGRAAIADLQEGDYGNAAINAGLVGLDLVGGGVLAKVVTKGNRIMDAGKPG